MGLFPNYAKEGPGVSKNEKPKSKMKHFFDIYLRHFWDITKVSLLFCLLCIPIVTIGPATAGLTSVLKKYSLEKHSFLWSDFWESFKKNFKQSIVVGIVQTLIFCCVVLCFYIYPRLSFSEGGNKAFIVPLIICMSLTLIMIFMNFYMYLMIVSVDLKLKYIVKNAFILSFAGIKTNFITFLVSFAIACALVSLILFNILFEFLIPLFAVGFISFLSIFNSYPIIQKYIINPYYETHDIPNPENETFELEDDDLIFTDTNAKKDTK